jgi:hypothetical protein
MIRIILLSGVEGETLKATAKENKKSGDAIVSAVEEEVSLLDRSWQVYQRTANPANHHHFVFICEIIHNRLKMWLFPG